MADPGKLVIDQETITKTECDKGFACLDETPVYCTAMNTLGRAMLTLVCSDQRQCRHNQRYGALQTCKCPVRHAIFVKYGK